MSITVAELEAALGEFPRKRIAVVGDLFLDRYFDIDGRLTEKSIETGLDAYQVVGTREYPGAAGTVLRNLSALGVGCIVPVTFIGDDMEGWALYRLLDQLPNVCLDHVIRTGHRLTPTYMKPLLTDCQPPRELNRLDKKNRTPVPAALVRQLSASLDDAHRSCDVVIAVDQVTEPECGVLGVALRERLCELAVRRPRGPVIVESRSRLAHYHHVVLHGNFDECTRAYRDLHGTAPPLEPDELATKLSRTVHAPVVCTLGERGAVVADGASAVELPAVPVEGPLDIVGAGDAVLAGTAATLAIGWPLHKAVQFGQLVAAITIRKLGETGTASPDELRALLGSRP